MQGERSKQSKPSKHRAKKAEEAQDDSDSNGGYTFVAVTGLKAEERCKDWIIDSGASRHMTFQKELLHGYKEFETPKPVGLGDGHVEALGAGRVKIITKLRRGKETPGWMNDVLFVPKLAGSLFSVRAAASNQKVVSLGYKDCWIRDA